MTASALTSDTYTATNAAPAVPLWQRMLYRVPLAGALIRDAGRSDNAQAFFALNIILLWVLAGFFFGIAGVLAVAYMLVPAVFAAILGVMLFSGA
jgi:hypothetical protein